MKRDSRFQFINHLLLFVAAVFFPITGMGQQATGEILIKTAGFTCKSTHLVSSNTLKEQIGEGSGLIAWNGQLWTHNDSGPPRIFALDSLSGTVVKTFDLPGVKNNDWEELSQDEHFLYLGDIGNNSGKRDRLRIYTLRKEGLLRGQLLLDSIVFQWPETYDFGKTKKINFDCEAMTVIGDSIFLFTKEWQYRRCSRVFKIPAKPGTHTAAYVSTIETRMLVTGAHYSARPKRIVLCGYSLFLTPKLLVLPLPSGDLRAIGKGAKIRLRQRLRQTEGIGSFNGKDFYIISEASDLWLWKNKPKLFRVRID